MLIRIGKGTDVVEADSPDANDAQPIPNKRGESPSDVATTWASQLECPTVEKRCHTIIPITLRQQHPMRRRT
jgi:hypothetical protein